MQEEIIVQLLQLLDPLLSRKCLSFCKCIYMNAVLIASSMNCADIYLMGLFGRSRSKYQLMSGIDDQSSCHGFSNCSVLQFSIL